MELTTNVQMYKCAFVQTEIVAGIEYFYRESVFLKGAFFSELRFYTYIRGFSMAIPVEPGGLRTNTLAI